MDQLQLLLNCPGSTPAQCAGGAPRGWAHRKGKSRLCFLWVLSAHHAWFEALPVPSREWCSRGCGGDPGQIPRAAGREDTQVSSMLQTGLCSASLSRRASESHRIPASSPAGPGGTSGMAHPLDTSPKNLLAADSHNMQPACLFTVGAARLQLQEEPVSKHGSMVFKELSDRLGAFGCRGGKRGATYAERSRKHKTGLGYSRQSSSGPLPSLGSCFGSCLDPGFQN